MKLGVQLQGLGELAAKLERVGRLGDPKTVRPALRRAGRVLARAMAERVRRRSGLTAASMGVREAPDQDGAAAVSVGPSERRAHIARFLEFGYVRRNKRTGAVTHIPAYPFVQAAQDASEQEMAEVMAAELTKAAQEILA